MVKVDNIYIKKGRKFITYTCQKHGQIEQREDHFKRANKECKMCRRENIDTSNMYRVPVEILIKRLEDKHENKYKYCLSNFTDSRGIVEYYCEVHGKQTQLYFDHLKGKGCPKCASKNSYNTRTKNKLNKKYKNINQPKDYKLIPLTQGKFAMVDNEDFDKLKHINWFYENGYADSSKHGKMHRLINKTPKHMYTDHINRDRLDNRKINLRSCTIQQNSFNSGVIKGSSSKYKGVSWCKKTNKWIMAISKGREYYSGYYGCEIEAAKAYDKKALELFGEFAYLNFKIK